MKHPVKLIKPLRKYNGLNSHKNPPKPSRNAPCFCKSGKKYKHCCGDAKMLSEKRKADDAAFFAALRARAAEREEKARSEGAVRRGLSMAGMMLIGAYAMGLGASMASPIPPRRSKF